MLSFQKHEKNLTSTLLQSTKKKKWKQIKKIKLLPFNQAHMPTFQKQQNC